MHVRGSEQGNLVMVSIFVIRRTSIPQVSSRQSVVSQERDSVRTQTRQIRWNRLCGLCSPATSLSPVLDGWCYSISA
ncbi:hypothetical protein BDV12DRAFT_159993 [Aspergillus spectabilis]